MLTCKNCGATYDENAKCCPYCGGDNTRKSIRDHRARLKNYNDEQEKWEEMPAVAAAKGMKLTVKVVAIAIVIAILLCLLAFFAKRISVTSGQKNKQSAAAAMEEMYEAGDYAGVRAYLEEKYQGRVDATLEKYAIVAWMERYVEYADEPTEDELAWLVQQDNAEFLTDVYYMAEILFASRESEAAGYKYGETDAVIYYSEHAYAYLEQYYGLSSWEVIDTLEEQEAAGATEEQKILKLKEVALASLKMQSTK